MSNTLDFNKLKKKYLTVILADEKNTTLMIGTPTKAVSDELMSMESYLANLTGDASEETLSEL